MIVIGLGDIFESTGKRSDFFQKVFASALEQVDSGKLSLIIPRSRDLYRKFGRSHFHCHSELFFQLGGTTEFECPGEKLVVEPSSVCLMPVGIAHAETPIHSKGPHLVLVCGPRPDGIYLIRTSAGEGRSIRPEYVEFRMTSRGRDAFFYLNEIADAPVTQRRQKTQFIEAAFTAFLITLQTELGKATESEPANHSSKIMAAENLARIHLSNPELSVAMLAKSMGCSADYLSRLFHAKKKVALGRWILLERVSMARDLLREGKYNVTEVGRACGFNSSSYFSRVFYKYTGSTPRAFLDVQSGRR